MIGKTFVGAVAAYLLYAGAFTFSAAYMESTHANEKKRITVFLQEALDNNGKVIPDTPAVLKFVQYFERETGMQFQRISLPWNRAKRLTLDGQGIIWGFSKSLERLQEYDFSEMVIRSRIWAIAYGEPKMNLRSVADLQGKTVSVERGVSHGMEFESVKNKFFKVDEDTASAAARFRKLIAKRSDVLLWGLVQFDQEDKILKYLHQTYVPSLRDPALINKHFYVSSAPMFYDSIHFASAKGRFKEELEKIDAAIKRGFKSGELSKILREME